MEKPQKGIKLKIFSRQLYVRHQDGSVVIFND
jgi:hypothetical protein